MLVDRGDARSHERDAFASFLHASARVSGEPSENDRLRRIIVCLDRLKRFLFAARGSPRLHGREWDPLLAALFLTPRLGSSDRWIQA